MAELAQHLSFLAIFSTIVFLAILAWLLFIKKIKNEKTTLIITILLIVTFFIGPVIIKTILTGGFLLPISDQTFMMTYIQKYQHTTSLVDPLIKNAPPYYPPLFFFVAGKVGQILSIENILITYNLANLLGLLTITLLVLAMVFHIIKKISQTWKFPLGVLFVFIFFAFMNFDFLLGKSYEVISYLLMLQIILHIDQKRENFSPLKVGLLAGVVVMLYFYSMLILFPALLCYLFFSKQLNKAFIFKIMKALFITLVVSLPYTWPLLKQVAANIINSQAAYVHMEINLSTFYPFLPDLNSLLGLCLVIATLVFYLLIRKDHLLLRCQLPIVYSFYLLNLLVIAFWQRPIFIMSRLWPFAEILFYSITILMLTRLLTFLIKKFPHEKGQKILKTSLLICLVLAYSNTLKSNLLRNPTLRQQERKITLNPSTLRIYHHFEPTSPQIISNYRELGLHYPVFYFLPVHLIYGNPFGRLKQRQDYLANLQNLEGDALYQAMSYSPFGTIDAILGVEKHGRIEVKLYPETVISLKQPLTYTFQVDRFNSPNFIKKRVGRYLLILIKESVHTKQAN